MITKSCSKENENQDTPLVQDLDLCRALGKQPLALYSPSKRGKRLYRI